MTLKLAKQSTLEGFVQIIKIAHNCKNKALYDMTTLPCPVTGHTFLHQIKEVKFACNTVKKHCVGRKWLTLQFWAPRHQRNDQRTLLISCMAISIAH